MLFRGIVQDVRDGFGSLSRRVHSRRKFHGSVHELDIENLVLQHSQWAALPQELLREIIKRVEASESTWPERRSLVFCASVCRMWRETCLEIVKSPEFSGKITFPISLKQPGPHEGHIQCFVKRDESNSIYYLYLCLSSDLLVENGKLLFAAKRMRRTTGSEYVISTQAKNISKGNYSYVGKLRSNFLSTKFSIYDTQPPYYPFARSTSNHPSRSFHSKKVYPKPPSGNFNIAEITYEANAHGNRGPRRMNCTMYSIPVSALTAGGTVPGQPKKSLIHPSPNDSFHSTTLSNSSLERSSDILGNFPEDECGAGVKDMPLVLQNKAPRWHEQLQCWCLNFRGRVTVASVKNFQLIAAAPSTNPASATVRYVPVEHDKVILQFGKVGENIFTMDYRYPLSAFQAFAICLSSFDTKISCA